MTLKLRPAKNKKTEYENANGTRTENTITTDIQIRITTRIIRTTTAIMIKRLRVNKMMLR